MPRLIKNGTIVEDQWLPADPDNPSPAPEQLLSLEQWNSTSLLLRLEHLYENNEDPELSKPANVSLKVRRSTFVELDPLFSYCRKGFLFKQLEILN